MALTKTRLLKHDFPAHGKIALQNRFRAHNRERKLNTNFFSQTFRAPPGHPGKIPARKKVWFPWASRDIPNFSAPTPSCGRPPPHPKISRPKSLGFQLRIKALNGGLAPNINPKGWTNPATSLEERTKQLLSYIVRNSRWNYTVDKDRVSYPVLVVQHCNPPYRAIGYSYTYRIYVFQCIAGYRAIPPPPFLGVSQNYVEGGGGVRGGLAGGYRSSSLPSAL